MAINLNPGADSTLVSAATKAGLASAPPSYAATFESVSANYHNTMMASAKMWGDIASAAVSMRGTYLANEKVRDSEGKGFAEKQKYLDEAREIRRKVARLNNMPDPQSKGQLADLQRQQERLYNGAEDFNTGYEALNTAMQNADEKANTSYDMQLALAVQAYRNGTGTTKHGNYLVSEENENGGKDYVMYHDSKQVTAKNIIPLGVVSPMEIGKMTSFGEDDLYIETTSDADLQRPLQRKHADLDELSGKPVLGMDGEKIKVDLDRLAKSIVPKDKGRVLQNTEDKRLQSMATFGVDSGTLNPAGLAKLGDDIDDLVSAYGKRAWHTPSVHSTSGDGKSMSFYGEYVGVDKNGNPTPTRVSAEGFASLSPQYLKKIGVKDVPGTQKGLDVDDFQSSDNYLRLTQAMFNPGDSNYSEAQTNKIFKDYKMRQSLGMVASTWNNSPKNPANQTSVINGPPDSDGFIPLNKATNADMFQGGNGAYISPAKLSAWQSIGKALVQRADMGKGNNLLSWDKEKKSYFHATEGVAPNKASLFAMLNFLDTGEENQLTSTFKQNPFYKQIPDWDGSMYIKNKEKVVDNEGDSWWKFWK